MKEHGILFSGAMVRALLAGRKTQTRRAVKGQFPSANERRFKESIQYGYVPASYTDVGPRPGVFMLTGAVGIARELGAPHEIRCPHPVGTRLWVRETWARFGEPEPEDGILRSELRDCGENGLVGYRCGLGAIDDRDDMNKPFRWTPGIHMPRWASRLTLDVTGVRVERAQEISDADVAAEGVDAEAVRALWFAATTRRLHEAVSFDGPRPPEPMHRWRTAWCLINGRASWDANPWVWVYSFTRTEAGR